MILSSVTEAAHDKHVRHATPVTNFVLNVQAHLYT